MHSNCESMGVQSPTELWEKIIMETIIMEKKKFKVRNFSIVVLAWGSKRKRKRKQREGEADREKEKRKRRL